MEENMITMEKLKELRDQGRISEEEFNVQSQALYEKSMRKAEGNATAKNGVAYIILAWFLGVIGIHNFYAGYWIRGLIQLGLTLVSWLFWFIPLLAVALWALGELLFENKDASGQRFRGNRSMILGLRIAAVLWLFFSIFYTYQKGDLVFQEEVVTVQEN